MGVAAELTVVATDCPMVEEVQDNLSVHCLKGVLKAVESETVKDTLVHYLRSMAAELLTEL